MQLRSAIAAGVTLSPEGQKLLDASSGDTLFDAVEKLGLKLEPRKTPMETLVIDEAQKTLSENKLIYSDRKPEFLGCHA